MQDKEYGARGIVGVAVPQANPTVEPELGCLMPAGVSLVTTRLTSLGADPRERLLEYASDFYEAPRSFDTLKLDALGFACTGSSYLVGAKEEDARTAEISSKLGYPLITAAQAIRAALSRLNAKRVAMLSPYPAWLTDACLEYWASQNIDVVRTAYISLPSSDTRGVYAIRTSSVLEACEEFVGLEADAVLLSGTGMPTLRALAPLRSTLGMPVLSSNFCLAWAMLDPLGLAAPAGSKALLEGYEPALARL